MNDPPCVRAGAALIAAATLLVVPNTAQALSCATNVAQLPVDGAVGVPTNTLLWGFADYTARLVGPGGALVPMEARLLPVSLSGELGIQQVVIPLQPLAPDTRYTLDSSNSASVTFTTGAGPREAPPALPVLLSVPSAVDSNIGEGYYVSSGLEFEHQGILIGDIGKLPPFTSVEELLIERPSELSQTRAEPLVEWLTAFGRPPVGVGDCLTWPEGAGDSVDARFGVLDLAGNFSGWADVGVRLPTEAETAELQAAAETRPEGPYSRPSACSLTPGTGTNRAPAWLTLALASLVQAARRRRRASPPSKHY